MEFGGDCILATGDLLRNGDEAAQGKFLKKFFEIYDRINSTTLHLEYEKSLAVARRNSKTQVDWTTSTDLLNSMNGIKGTGYAAVLRWVIAAHDDVNFRNSVGTSENKQLLDLAEEACKWRQQQFDFYCRKGKADGGHRTALELWKDVRNKVKEIRDEARNRQFLAVNNNFKDYENMFKK